MTNHNSALKGKLLYFLLTDDYGIGESQCKIERVIQCAPIPQHRQRDAKDAIDDMLRETSVPLYSKGGGSRDVVQIVPGRLERARELANEWHPKRSPGELFDRTDLSSPDRDSETFSVDYKHKSRVWEYLEGADVEFDHRHGAESDRAPADHIEFTIDGSSDEVADVIADLTDATSGDLCAYGSDEAKSPKVTA